MEDDEAKGPAGPKDLDPKYLVPDDQDQMMKLCAAFLCKIAAKGDLPAAGAVSLMMSPDMIGVIIGPNGAQKIYLTLGGPKGFAELLNALLNGVGGDDSKVHVEGDPLPGVGLDGDPRRN